MSILYRSNRPLIAFDVTNALHRKWYAEFVKYNTWGRCPVRFMTESLDQDLVSHINDKLLHYYLKQEFQRGKAKTKTTKTASRSPLPSRTLSKRKSVQAKSSKVKTTVSA
jgi:hypothetical protein